MFGKLSVIYTRRYGPLRPSGKKRAYYAVLPIIGHFWCSVATLVTFSSNLCNFEKNPTIQKYIQKNLKIIQKSKNEEEIIFFKSKKFQENHKQPKKKS